MWYAFVSKIVLISGSQRLEKALLGPGCPWEIRINEYQSAFSRCLPRSLSSTRQDHIFYTPRRQQLCPSAPFSKTQYLSSNIQNHMSLQISSICANKLHISLLILIFQDPSLKKPYFWAFWAFWAFWDFWQYIVRAWLFSALIHLAHSSCFVFCSSRM